MMNFKSLSRENWIGYLYFLVLLPSLVFVKVFYSDGQGFFIPMATGGLYLSATANEFVERFNPSDTATQLGWALDYLKNPQLAGNFAIDFWPPGMPFFYLIVLKFTGASYFVLKMAILGAFLYGLSGISLYIIFTQFFRGAFSKFAIGGLFLVPFFYSSFSGPLFYGLGIFSSDFYCFCFLTIFFSLLLKNKENYSNIFYIAIILAVLIYIRSFYYILFEFYIKTIIIIAIIYAFLNFYKYKKIKSIYSIYKNPFFKNSLLLIAIIYLLVAPWKIFYLNKNNRDFSWTATEQVWAAHWRNDYPADTFLIGINTSCLVNKPLCEKLFVFQSPDTWTPSYLGSNFYKNLTLTTYLSNPIAWYREKLRVFDSFWFDGIRLSLVPFNLSSFFSFIIIITVLILFAISLYIIFYRKLILNDPSIFNIKPYIFYAVFTLQNIMVFTFVHYEPRYSVPLKWVTLMMAIFLLASFLNSRRKL